MMRAVQRLNERRQNRSESPSAERDPALNDASASQPISAPPLPAVSSAQPEFTIVEEHLTECGYVVDIAIFPYRIALQLEGPTHFFRGGAEIRTLASGAAPAAASASVAGSRFTVNAASSAPDDNLRIDIQPDRTQVELTRALRKSKQRKQSAERPAHSDAPASVQSSSASNAIIDSEVRAENRSLGPKTLMQYQHLADSGWTVVSLPYFTWMACSNARQRTQLLASLHPALAVLANRKARGESHSQLSVNPALAAL